VEHGRLAQPDFEDLSAFVDGELPPARAAEVEALVAADPAWRKAHRELTALDAALNAYTVPDPPADLAERIVRGAGEAPRPLVVRIARYLAPLAAAAAVVLAVVLWSRPRAKPPAGDAGTGISARPVPGDGLVRSVLSDVPDADVPVVENLPFVRSLKVCEVIAENESILDDATCDALDVLDGEQRGT